MLVHYTGIYHNVIFFPTPDFGPEDYGWRYEWNSRMSEYGFTRMLGCRSILIGFS